MEQYFYLSAILSACVGVIFSGFMMFTMWKTYRTAKKTSEGLMKGVEELKENVTNIGNSLGGLLGGHTIEMNQPVSALDHYRIVKTATVSPCCGTDFPMEASFKNEVFDWYICNNCGKKYNHDLAPYKEVEIEIGGFK